MSTGGDAIAAAGASAWNQRRDGRAESIAAGLAGATSSRIRWTKDSARAKERHPPPPYKPDAGFSVANAMGRNKIV